MTETTTTDMKSKTLLIAATTARWIIGLTLWTLQYGFLVWVYAAWRLTVTTAKTAGVAVVLLFVPILGWIVLYLIISHSRSAERHHAESMAAMGHPITAGTDWKAVFTPWALAWVKGT